MPFPVSSKNLCEKLTTPLPCKNGDPISLQLWIALLSVSSGGLITTSVLGKKKKETAEE